MGGPHVACHLSISFYFSCHLSLLVSPMSPVNTHQSYPNESEKGRNCPDSVIYYTIATTTLTSLTVPQTTLHQQYRRTVDVRLRETPTSICLPSSLAINNPKLLNCLMYLVVVTLTGLSKL